jgi:hypothetical protein
MKERLPVSEIFPIRTLAHTARDCRRTCWYHRSNVRSWIRLRFWIRRLKLYAGR